MIATLLALLLAAASPAAYTAPAGWINVPDPSAVGAADPNAESARAWLNGNDKLMWMLSRGGAPSVPAVKAAFASPPAGVAFKNLTVRSLRSCSGPAVWLSYTTKLAARSEAYDSIVLFVERSGQQAQIRYGFLDGEQPDRAVIASMTRYCKAFNT